MNQRFAKEESIGNSGQAATVDVDSAQSGATSVIDVNRLFIEPAVALAED